MLKLALVTSLIIQAVSFIFLGFLFWLQSNFSTTNFEQVLFYINQGTQLVGQVNRNMVIQFVVYVIALPLLVVTIELFLIRLIFNKKTNFSRKKIILIFSGLSVLSLFASIVFVEKNLNISQYLTFQKYDTLIDENYVFPQNAISPTDKHNLVIIYVESLENEFSNSELFDQNLISRLDSTTKDWHSFPNYSSDWGGWTIASLVATQCALPLKQSSESLTTDEVGNTVVVGGNDFGTAYDAFMPGAHCLGDVLKENGYTNIFMGGADSYFAGKGKFLSEHGYDTILDRNHWVDVGESYLNDWGLPDNRLLENAKVELTSLYETSQPFNLTILTLDTHLQGEHSETCAPVGEKIKFAELLTCSTNQVADFINWMRNEGFLENTSVVVVGDHLHMGNEEINPVLNMSTNRTVFNRFYSSLGVEPNREETDQIDFFPTVLGLLGFKFGNGQLGLGITGFGIIDSGVKSISETSGYLDRIGYKSKLIDSIWSTQR